MSNRWCNYCEDYHNVCRQTLTNFAEKHAAKKDATHKPICDRLRKHGAEVLEQMQPLDLLVFYKGLSVWLEVKIPGSRAVWTATQLRFIADTKFSVAVVKSEDEAVKVLRDRAFLNQRQKDAIAALLAINSKARYTPGEVEKVLGK